MKTLKLMARAGDIGFSVGFFHVKNNHFTFSSKVEDTNIFLIIMVCCHEKEPQYSVTLSVDNNEVINKVLLKEDEFDLLLPVLETQVKRVKNEKNKKRDSGKENNDS